MFFKLAVYKIKRYWHFFKTGLLSGLTAQIRYSFPNRKLKILTITGTDGKTTSSTLLYHILKTAGHKVALISTVAAYIGEEAIDTGFHVTSPDPRLLYKFLKELVDKGYEYVVLEVTSHGSYQYRNWGIRALISGLTNISHEHLDYHVSYLEYLKAKSWILKKSQIAVINADDQSYSGLKKELKFWRQRKNHHLLSYSENQKLPRPIQQAMHKRFPEEYNRMNARLVTMMSEQIAISPKVIAAAIESFPGVPGRMETIVEKPVQVLIDFAHTPRAIEEALKAAKKLPGKKNKLIAVYGSAGLRDQSKRPKMGLAGVTHADHVVLTAEDPRTEDVWSIIRQMKEQLNWGQHKISSIADRYKAIEFALKTLAAPGDVVIIMGKGHEQSMCFGNTEYPWSDKQAVLQILGLEK